MNLISYRKSYPLLLSLTWFNGNRIIRYLDRRWFSNCSPNRSLYWRVSREITIADRNDIKWLPPADIMNLISMLVTFIGVFALPIAGMENPNIPRLALDFQSFLMQVILLLWLGITISNYPRTAQTCLCDKARNASNIGNDYCSHHLSSLLEFCDYNYNNKRRIIVEAKIFPLIPEPLRLRIIPLCNRIPCKTPPHPLSTSQ